MESRRSLSWYPPGWVSYGEQQPKTRVNMLRLCFISFKLFSPGHRLATCPTDFRGTLELVVMWWMLLLQCCFHHPLDLSHQPTVAALWELSTIPWETQGDFKLQRGLPT